MKKEAKSKNKRDQFVNSKGTSKAVYVAIGVVAVLAMVAIAFFVGPKSTQTGVEPTPEEAKYIGRYLPESYKPVKLTEPIKYDQRIDMTDIAPEVKDGYITFSAGDVIKNRIVYFEYMRPSDSEIISMMAYIKPNGELFTGVSYCPPCQAKRHYFDTDGTLTCGSCATKRDPITEAGLSGACKLYPFDEMPHRMVGDNIQIAEADMAKWTVQPLDRPVGE